MRCLPRVGTASASCGIELEKNRQKTGFFYILPSFLLFFWISGFSVLQLADAVASLGGASKHPLHPQS